MPPSPLQPTMHASSHTAPIPITLAASPRPAPTLAASPLSSSLLSAMPEPKYSFSKDKIRVLALDNVHASALRPFKSETFQVDFVPKGLSEDELCHCIKGVHLLCIRFKTKVTKRVGG